MEPKPDMNIKVILVIDGEDILKTYQASDIGEIDWQKEMTEMANSILNYSDDWRPEPPRNRVNFFGNI